MKKGGWIFMCCIGALGCKDPAQQASDKIRKDFDSINNSIQVEDHSVEAQNRAILKAFDSLEHPKQIKDSAKWQ